MHDQVQKMEIEGFEADKKCPARGWKNSKTHFPNTQ